MAKTRLRSATRTLSIAFLFLLSRGGYFSFAFFHSLFLLLPSFFGHRPRKEPEGTKSCKIQGESVYLYVCPFIRTSVHPPKDLQRPGPCHAEAGPGLSEAGPGLSKAGLGLSEAIQGHSEAGPGPSEAGPGLSETGSGL